MPDLDPRREIALLVDSAYPIIYLETWEEARASAILTGVAEDVGVPYFEWAVTTGLARSGGAPIYNTQEPAQALAAVSAITGDGLFLLKDFHKYMDQDVIVRKLRDLAQEFRRARRAIIITSPVVNIPVELEKDTARFALDLPDEVELNQLAVTTVRELSAHQHLKNELPLGQMPVLARSLRGLTLDEARRILTQCILPKSCLEMATIGAVLEAKTQLVKDQGIIEFSKPEAGLMAVGGLTRLKAWLEKRRGAFSREAERYGLDPPKGILIFGVQGCGKSLCAKAVAQEWNLALLKFDTSRLLEKYVGESEKNMRKSLQVAEAVAPAVLWIDEIEKMFPHAALTSDADGGLSMRLFGMFLTWMQEKKSPVFIVATSNDISALPPEFLRKGRFDELFFVDLPDAGQRQAIFSIHLSKHQLDPVKFDLTRLAGASEGFSGAEIEEAVKSALYSAFDRKSPLSTDMLLEELRSTYPLAVTMKEKIEALREWARERAVPAN
ncbi:MAG: AAA family ATPase [Acidobacteriota bacterium]|nr:AAA family ATPase [Acidobacteriota bacterium]